MRYFRADDATSPQLLSLLHQGEAYTLNLVHATIGEERRHSPFPRVAHQHPYYHILLYMAGQNGFLLGEGSCPSRPGVLVLCPPNLPHDFGPLAAGSTVYDEVTFELVAGEKPLLLPMNDLLSLYAGVHLSPLPLSTHLRAAVAREVRTLMQAVTAAATSALPTSLFDAHRGLLDLLALLVTQFAQLPPAAADRVAEARRQISRRFAEPIGIDQLAAELGLASTYLARAFRQRYGVSPLEYRQELRASAARRLLQMGALTQKEIAARLGFADVHTFSKAFTRRYGTPPGQMRATR